ncbi:hypothetical protein ABZV91_31955 [Nocardia sp. NPDC004568]|uniref:hypothetical protein n=1 Tax=Nocardia sp. NPDC004568 TaxID=3154551 RepID=UPI0033A93B7B
MFIGAEQVSRMIALLPLAYGHLRDDLVHDRDAGDDALRAAARPLGHEPATVFHETSSSGLLPPAFVDLIQECRRAAVRKVLTLQGHMTNTSMSPMFLHEILFALAAAVVHEDERGGVVSRRSHHRTIRACGRARPTARR